MERKHRIHRITYLLSLLVLLSTFWFSTCVSVRAAEADIDLEISQTITATNTDRTDLGCSYVLEAETEGAPMPEGAADGKLHLTMSGNQASEKLHLHFTESGEYRYQIARDGSSTENGYTYDETAFHIVAFVDYYNGVFSAEVKVLRGNSQNKVPQILFEHTYSPTGVCEVDPPVKKVVKGTPQEDSTFEFKMASVDTKNPMPEGSEDGVKKLQIQGSGEGEFGVITFTKPGKYFYIISEVNTGEEGYTYDKMAYTVKCVVVDDNGTLKLTKTITDASGNEVEAATFTNTYSPTVTNTVTPSPAPTEAASVTPAPASGGGTTGTTGSVKTGDDTNILLWGVLLTVSLCSLCMILLYRKREN